MTRTLIESRRVGYVIKIVVYSSDETAQSSGNCVI